LKRYLVKSVGGYELANVIGEIALNEVIFQFLELLLFKLRKIETIVSDELVERVIRILNRQEMRSIYKKENREREGERGKRTWDKRYLRSSFSCWMNHWRSFGRQYANRSVKCEMTSEKREKDKRKRGEYTTEQTDLCGSPPPVHRPRGARASTCSISSWQIQ